MRGGDLLRLLRAAARFVRDCIGLKRIGFAFSLCIIAVALAVLHRMLEDTNLDDVLEAVRATPSARIALAACFVGAGYLTLTFYDYFALRALGLGAVPYRIAALAGFTSYSVGHNIGAATLTGGAVRYRIYSAWGLDAIDVAKVCFLAGLTFWLGNATILGLGIAFEPQAATAIDRLPPTVNRMLAAVVLAVLASYVIWVWRAPRVAGRSGWMVKLPNGPSTLVQIAIGIAYLGTCALAMYVLLPGNPPIAFATLAVIFVVATVFGFASRAPGGLGVFDAAMLVALPQFAKAELLAGLLLFRLLYYLAPLVLSLLILGTREILISIASARVDRDQIVTLRIEKSSSRTSVP